MIENILETRSELKENRAVVNMRAATREQSTSGTDTQSQTQSESNKPLATPTESQSSEQLDGFHPEKTERKAKQFVRKLSLPYRSKHGGGSVSSPPQSLNLSDTVQMDMLDHITSDHSPAESDHVLIGRIQENTPLCWRNLYHLLELYSIKPQTKMVIEK